MADLEHPSFQQPTNMDIWLWRYMDLSKFAALLQNKTLVFCRSDLLGDAFEGSLPEPNARIAEHILAVRRTNPDKDPHPGMTDHEVEVLYQGLSAARKRAVKAHFISCWHMNEAESAGMWKLYSKSSDAVCIRTDYRTLANELPSECFMGLVDYIDFRTAVIPSDNFFAPYLVKRRSFSHEREARVVLVDYAMLDHPSPPSIKEIGISLGKVVQQVYVSPDAPSWFGKVVQDLCDKYDLHITVQQSNISGTPIY